MLCQRAGVPDTVKVLDFGLIKSVDPRVGSDVTQEATLVGTPQYLSPETIMEPGQVGPASDVYALGAVGFFLVTGRDVFEANTLIELCFKHVSAAPERPSEVLQRQMHADLEGLLLRCLAKDPTQRPADGARLADALATLSIDGWTSADARAWWRRRRAIDTNSASSSSGVRSQLTIDLSRRLASM